VTASARTASSDGALRSSLVPLADALLRAARREADQILVSADQEARERLRGARAQADEIREQASARAAVDSAELIAVARAQARREARGIVLAAQRAVYEALRDSARRAVARLCDEPEYPSVRRRMTARLRQLLGDGVQVQDAPGGGLIGHALGRSVDLALARLADRAVDTVLAEEPTFAEGAGAAVRR
jgi:vacuolar-type H+-ATPase subunit H